MRKKSFVNRQLGLFAAICMLLSMGTSAMAGDDPSIKGELRENIQTAMQSHIDNNTVGGVYYIYDPVDGKMMNLTFKELHKGIVKKGNFYVSCADFTDGSAKMIDLDFLVIPDGDRMLVTQAVVHSVDGKKRKYHLEN
ncbi:MAG: hypothetical protein JRF72_07900 [Deltaproteobacteria bacterium]|jgi:hypothetical protein|nr:hypothetical protein [Deltaproteobacteria bacterium]